MSTFNGVVSEFPQIRIDYFRTLPGRPAPLACFLSHVHSDHLQGLESLRSPFVYCSPATRSLVLKLEKYPHRMNFAKGILECRKQTYKHLRTLLKAIPLETPTNIELSPGNNIRVTLFDANHCLGAVSFLIEGDGKAVFYTGDVRAEPWWIESLTRHPKIIPYARGLRKLDMLYLDTTNANKAAEYLAFPSKADGIAELLARVKSCNEGTIFYFHAWTFGYEDAWLALSQALNSRIHLDRYRYSIYTSIAQKSGPGHESREAAWLCGYTFGNSEQAGILTRQPDNVRIHSCEKGTECHVVSSNDANIIQIIPIVSRHKGMDMRELGAGGGKGDLDQIRELDLSDDAAVAQLATLSATNLPNQTALKRVESLLQAAKQANQTSLPLQLPETWKDTDDAITLPQTIELLAQLASKPSTVEGNDSTTSKSNTIKFPYSRHSSYTELRALVQMLNTRDIYPCTAPPESAWDEGTMSMASLFGDLLERDTIFSWDDAMKRIRTSRLAHTATINNVGEAMEQEEQVSQVDASESSDSDDVQIIIPPHPSPPLPPPSSIKTVTTTSSSSKRKTPQLISPPSKKFTTTSTLPPSTSNNKSTTKKRPAPQNTFAFDGITEEKTLLSPQSQRRLQARREAFAAADEGRWHEVELASVDGARTSESQSGRRMRRRRVEVEEEL